MKIVHVLNFYGDNLGTQEVVRALVQRELAAGYSSEIVTSDLSKNTENDICNVTRLRTFFTFSRTPFTPSLWRHILNKKADIFHLHGPLPFFDSVLSLKRVAHGNCKFIYRIQNLTFENQFYTRFLSLSYRNTALRVAARVSDVTITLTNALTKMLGTVLDQNKTVVIPNGIEVDDYTASYSYPPNFLFIGSIKPDKGIHILIKAFQKIKSVLDNPTLNIVGTSLWDDAYSLKLKTLTKSDPSIIWHGWASGNRKKELLANAGVVVLPSVSLTEGFGLALLEGMASGKPIVASNLPTIAEWVDPSFGLLFPTGNIDKLAKKLLQALNTAEDLGRTGRRYIENVYNWDQIFTAYRNIYESF